MSDAQRPYSIAIPLEQGLRPSFYTEHPPVADSIVIPLEQGLRQLQGSLLPVLPGLFYCHSIRTRIKTEM